MSLIQMQRHLNTIRHTQPQNRLIRHALNRILEAKRGALAPEVAALAYQASLS